MKHPAWLWKAAISLWACAVMMHVIPGVAEASVVQLGDISFNFSQVIILLAIGCAWGDIRQRVSSVEKRLEKLEE